MAHPVVARIRSGVCRRNRFILSSELKPGVNMLAKKYPQGSSAWVARIAPKRLGLALILVILGLGLRVMDAIPRIGALVQSSPYHMWRL